jgi:hypothetical protein
MFPLDRLIRLAGLRWKYSTLPPSTVKYQHEYVNTYVYIVASSMAILKQALLGNGR